MLARRGALQVRNKPFCAVCRSLGKRPEAKKPSTLERLFGVTEKEKVVILGTGWASFRLIRSLQDDYEITVVSPRNHFLFTPLLASTTVGTLEFRSIVEPLRTSRVMDHVTYYQGSCIEFSPGKNSKTTPWHITAALTRFAVIRCSDPHRDNEFEVKYDKLVIGVGARNNTFGVPGVEENAFFLKELSDARRIRSHLLQRFEEAVMPNISLAEKKR